jgi:hypothetical protein
MNESQVTSVISPSTIQIRGYTSYNTPALGILISLSRLIDFCFISIIVLICAQFIGISPAPKLSLLFLFIFVFGIYLFPQKRIYGLTLGERTWLLKAKVIEARKTPSCSSFARMFRSGFIPKNRPALSEVRLARKLYQRDFLSPTTVFLATFFTTTSVLVTYQIFKRVVLDHPNCLTAQEWKLAPFIPNELEWKVSPFFYILGAWPKNFMGNSVSYSLPYELGPPKRFVGHVISYWEHPDISVTFEGPKTPVSRTTAAQLRDCFRSTPTGFNCLELRDQELSRHIAEMGKSRHVQNWSLKWFRVDNPNLFPQDTPQGIYLSAQGRSWVQDRFIFIGNNGAHQAIILRRPKNEKGTHAFEVFKNSLGSIRNFEDLSAGQAWTNRELEETRLIELKNQSLNSHYAENLQEIQQLLISKITLDPADITPYFHLAGTSAMLAKADPSQRVRVQLALDNLESAERFAGDISPNDVRLDQIRKMEKEIRKLFPR